MSGIVSWTSNVNLQDLRVKITDINIIEKKLPYIYNPPLAKASLFIERLDLIESIPDIERTKEEKESFEKIKPKGISYHHLHQKYARHITLCARITFLQSQILNPR